MTVSPALAFFESTGAFSDAFMAVPLAITAAVWPALRELVVVAAAEVCPACARAEDEALSCARACHPRAGSSAEAIPSVPIARIPKTPNPFFMSQILLA
jgi:hypothetical protein